VTLIPEPPSPVRLTFLLDTPNLWRGTAIAGTPARITEFAAALERRGAQVRMVLCDRGMTRDEAGTWRFPGLLVHPSAYYGPPGVLAACLAEWSADLLVLTDAEMIATGGRRLADLLGARLLYEAHDDEAALSASLGESAAVTSRRGRWQSAAVAAADFVTALTERDAVALRGYGVPAGRLAVLPTGCDVQRRTCWGPDPASGRLLFVGNLYYQPNAQAARAVTTLVREMQGRRLPACGRIVGRGPAALMRPEPGVCWRGPVRDLDAECRGVALAMAPLTSGSGMKMKMLTYLAAGLPVLATSEAVSGLGAGHPGVVVCDDLARWPRVAAGLLASPGRLARLGREGRAYVASRHSWDRIAGRALDAYCRWLAMPARVRGDVPVPDGAGEPLWLAEHASQDALGQSHLTSPHYPFAELPALRQAARLHDGRQ
jgi:glycosyltransferase involved in cell wall biosynthesis